MLHKIHAVAALGWTVLFVLCCEYKLFGPILSYSDVSEEQLLQCSQSNPLPPSAEQGGPAGGDELYP